LSLAYVYLAQFLLEATNNIQIREELNPSQVYMNAFDNAIHLYKSVLNQTVPLTQDSSLSPVAGYKFYTGTVSDIGLQLNVDLYAESNGTQYMVDFQQTSTVGNVPILTPTNVTDSSTTPSSTQNGAAAGVRLPSSRTAALSFGALLAVLLVLS
jgi:hypothetical protein